VSNWIDEATRNKGGLRRRAERLGMVRSDKTLDLMALKKRGKEKGDTKLIRQVQLALTLRRISARKRV